MSELKTDDKRAKWARGYETALSRFLRQKREGRNLMPAARLGRQAAPLGLETLDVVKVHEQALNKLTQPEDESVNAGQELLERADTFFKETIVPIEATHRAARKANIRIDRLTRTLQRREAESSDSDRQLDQAIAQRETVEASADERAVGHEKLLAEAESIQKQLRDRMHGIMSQQEDERKRLGGELRNDIAQALLAIDLSLLALNTSKHVDTEKTEKSIAEARRILKQLNKRGRKSDKRQDSA